MAIIFGDADTREVEDWGNSDYARAKDKARRLLQQIVTPEEWKEFEERDTITIRPRQSFRDHAYTYTMSPYSQTEIRDHKGRIIAYACLTLSIPAPTYDKMIAEYLLIKNNERAYFRTANIFSRSGNEIGIAVLFLLAFDITLIINLALSSMTGKWWPF